MSSIYKAGFYKIILESLEGSDHKEISWECVDWIHLAQDRSRWFVHEKTVMNLWVSQTAGKFMTS
jgi:hypothetical protein